MVRLAVEIGTNGTGLTSQTAPCGVRYYRWQGLDGRMPGARRRRDLCQRCAKPRVCCGVAWLPPAEWGG